MAQLKGGTTISGYISLHSGNFNPLDYPEMKGPQGPQGDQGNQGPQGNPGPSIRGNQGVQGFQGNIGPSIRGNQGVQGFQGNPGGSLTGFEGPRGPQGNVGTGIIGFQGFQGYKGDPGSSLTGFQGFQGYKGDPGPGITGYQGDRGYIGYPAASITGYQGYQGYKGDPGDSLRGYQGFQGNTGGSLRGFQGFKGDPGPSIRGNQGTRGRQGTATRGVQGYRGNQGTRGRQGNGGPRGRQGNRGSQGTATRGFQGFQGYTATRGRQGNQGFKGYQGRQGTQGANGTGTGLERKTDGGTGFRLIGSNTSNFGPLGSEAVDLSFSTVASSTIGATSAQSFASGQNPIVSGTGNNTVLGGYANHITTGFANTIAGANQGKIITSGSYNAIGAGHLPLINGDYNCIGAGLANEIYGSKIFLSGYNNDTATAATDGAILGGSDNSLLGYNNVILGGMGLEANDYCEIVGGKYNVISTGVKSSWTSTDSLFVLGNGASSGARTNAFQVLKNGTVRSAGDMIAYYSSDENLKDNITLISDPIEKVLQLRGATWDWNDNADKIQKTLPNVGLIAQDVEKVLPQLVHKRDNGQLALDYPKMVSVLVEFAKTQQKQLDSIKEILNNSA